MKSNNTATVKLEIIKVITTTCPTHGCGGKGTHRGTQTSLSPGYLLQNLQGGVWGAWGEPQPPPLGEIEALSEHLGSPCGGLGPSGTFFE